MGGLRYEVHKMPPELQDKVVAQVLAKISAGTANAAPPEADAGSRSTGGIMKKYIGTKVVQAEPALHITDKWGKKSVETLASKPVVLPGSTTVEGYKVVYKDGYESFSPKKVFEESYREIPTPKAGQQKAMLSQPMAGRTQEEIVAARELAVAVLEDAGYHVVNTLFTDDWYKKDAMKERGVEQIPLQFLARSLESMSLCHCAYFCKGWEDARGCRIEHQAAIEYGLDIIYEE